MINFYQFARLNKLFCIYLRKWTLFVRNYVHNSLQHRILFKISSYNWYITQNVFWPWAGPQGMKEVAPSCKVTEFWYGYSVTMNILKTIKWLVLQLCYGLNIFLHRMTGLCYTHIKISHWKIIHVLQIRFGEVNASAIFLAEYF